MRLLVLLLLVAAVPFADHLAPGPRPRPASDETRAVIGHYGEGREALLLFERNTLVYALAGSRRFALQRVAPWTYAAVGAPAWLGGDTLRFAPGTAFSPQFSTPARVFAREPLGPDEGDVFRIVPRRPVADIREEARRQHYPEAGTGSDLVDLEGVVPRIRLDVRYATDSNFMGAAFYSQARAFLQRPAAQALAVVADSLAPYGYGLVIYDAYRPWSVTWAFWEATPPALRHYVANPAKGSRHNRGCAVDLGLYHLDTGATAEMPSDYDEFTRRADPYYPGGTALARWHRDLLRRAMQAQRFSVNPEEWWHFDLAGCESYPVQNIPFERIATASQ